MSIRNSYNLKIYDVKADNIIKANKWEATERAKKPLPKSEFVRKADEWLTIQRFRKKANEGDRQCQL